MTFFRITYLFLELKDKIFYTLARCVLTSEFRVWFLRHCSGITIGRDVYLGENLTITRSGMKDILYIGDRAAIAPNVTIITSSSPEQSRLNRYNLTKRKKVIIEQDAWVGTGVIILPGIVISEGAICGAGAVVTKNVPPYTMVIGNPAKVLKTLKKS